MGHTAIETFRSSGAKAMNQTLGNDATTDQYDGGEFGLTRFTQAAHGYLINSQLYMLGVSYVGPMVHLHVVATNTFDVRTRIGGFTAETPPGNTTELVYPGARFNEPALFKGFALHLDSACATAEDFEIHVDAAAGSAFDRKLFDIPMNAVTDYVKLLDDEHAIPLAALDVIKCTFANTDTNTWGLELYFKRQS